MAPPINPQILAALMQQGGGPNIGNAPVAPPPIAGGAPAGPLPPTSPVQPAGGGIDLASIVGQISNLPAYQQSSSRLEDIGTQEQAIQKQMGGMALPKMGPQIEKGAGFFHNLGQALLLASEMTRPGQAVNQAIYGPGIREYATRQGVLSKQLEALKEQEAIPTEELRATTGLAQAGGLLGYRQGQLAVQKERADAYVESIRDRAQNYAATQDWRAAGLSEKTRHDKAQEIEVQAQEAGRNFRSLHRDATTEEVAHIVTGTREQIANEAAARDPSVKSWLFNALGISVPQVQGAPSPEFRPTPKEGETKPAAKTPAKRRTIDLTK
jgi:hypothetical protein